MQFLDYSLGYFFINMKMAKFPWNAKDISFLQN